ncbi:hypothetical protein [Burkholderia gladioli]|uniref:hypothetical protein n=1 Tax=Burkholderia gladioli TaxID=28095 RepID=UPI0013DE38EB|nr:hypothetical protein [Burkholderia gladioli]MBJ9714074.1 hypothetical protein [Burkholderia gladioli]MBU9158568.1 hypothetical protein [Burkholderia gladioli]MBU9215615.1 hypothetical protein [Burkholderia gladioli]MCH7272411.1 hypothetical protein [Burkholderia gladioli]MDC6128121.1 hypothetical protein [Burkholderia gladioli]
MSVGAALLGRGVPGCAAGMRCDASFGTFRGARLRSPASGGINRRQPRQAAPTGA